MSVIRQRYEEAARQEALGDLIQSTFYEAIVAEKLNPGRRSIRRAESVRKRQGSRVRRYLRSVPGV